MTRRPLAAGLTAVVLALSTGACRVDAGVAIDTGADGAGEVRATVTLDAEAVAAIGDLRRQIEVTDLRSTGWRVEGPTARNGGGSEITASHPFDDAGEAERLLVELAGADGPFEDFRVEQRRAFLKTHTTLRGVVDLRRGLGSFSDPRLAEALGGAPLGVTDEQLATHAGAPLERNFDLQLAARLPGRVESNAPAETDTGAAWPVELGERVVVEATSEQWNRTTLVASAVSAASGVLLLVVLVARTSRAVRRRRPPARPEVDGYSG